MKCQSFKEGCCGCCVNMRWHEQRIIRYLHANTNMAAELLDSSQPPDRKLMRRWHLHRGGWWDHLLAFWLVPFTFGFSLLIWKHWLGSCCFAGYLDPNSQRVGCLIHPARLGTPDLRKYAFPQVPTLSCNRELICPMLRHNPPPATTGWLAVSRIGAASLRN